MTLIKCKECGGDVSDKAEICPHCGFNAASFIRKPVKKYPVLRVVIITTTALTVIFTSFLVPLIWFIVMCFVCSGIDEQKYDKSWVRSLRSQCGIITAILFGISVILTIILQ